MNKALLLPIALMAMLSTTAPIANAKVVKVYKQTATVYQMKKHGKTYKIVSHTKKTTDKDISVGKTIVIKGQRYYYSHVFKGFITDKAFALNAKLDAKRANTVDSYDTKKKSKKTNTSSKNSSNTSSNNDSDTNSSKVVNGYDENNQKIVDMNAFINALTQISFNKLNEFRTSQGLQPLTMDNSLNQIAQVRAKTEAEKHWNNDNSHYDSNGTPLAFNVADQLGITINKGNWGENAGEYDMTGLDHTADIGNQSVQDAIDEGPTGGHYQNDVSQTFTKCGIGFYVDNGTVGYVLELQ